MNWHLNRHLALLPQRYAHVPITASKLSVIVQETVSLAVDIRWSDYDGVVELIANSLFSLVLRTKRSQLNFFSIESN
jgi:hypothetical protein